MILFPKSWLYFDRLLCYRSVHIAIIICSRYTLFLVCHQCKGSFFNLISKNSFHLSGSVWMRRNTEVEVGTQLNLSIILVCNVCNLSTEFLMSQSISFGQKLFGAQYPILLGRPFVRCGPFLSNNPFAGPNFCCNWLMASYEPWHLLNLVEDTSY